MDPDDVARKIFAEVDLNDDVVLSADELRAWMECKGEERLSNALFAQLDTDGDGPVSLQEFVDGFCSLRGNLAKFVHVDSPMHRAVALAWLAQIVKAHTGTTKSWDVVKEFIAEEDGGGKDTSLIVTSDNIEIYRDKRRAAERTKSGKPVPLEYRDIPFEQMYTTDIVECFVRRSLANTQRPHELRSGEEPSCWRADVLCLARVGKHFCQPREERDWGTCRRCSSRYVRVAGHFRHQPGRYGWSVFGDG